MTNKTKNVLLIPRQNIISNTITKKCKHKMSTLKKTSHTKEKMI